MVTLPGGLTVLAPDAIDPTASVLGSGHGGLFFSLLCPDATTSSRVLSVRAGPQKDTYSWIPDSSSAFWEPDVRQYSGPVTCLWVWQGYEVLAPIDTKLHPKWNLDISWLLIVSCSCPSPFSKDEVLSSSLHYWRWQPCPRVNGTLSDECAFMYTV